MLTVVPTDCLVLQSRLYSPDYAHAYITNYDFNNLQYANNNVNHYHNQTFIFTHKSITSKRNVTK